MLTRRSFLGPLLLAPVATSILPTAVSSTMLMPRDHIKTTIEPVSQQPRHLPIGCDLAFSSLQWAIDIAKAYRLGKPKILFVGPENKFHARKLLGIPHKPYTSSSEINVLRDDLLVYEVIRSMPMYTWKLVFEYGVVISEGPC